LALVGRQKNDCGVDAEKMASKARFVGFVRVFSWLFFCRFFACVLLLD